MSAKPLDPREHPFREDLAASYLKSEIDVPRYADGEASMVHADVLPVYGAASTAAGRTSELLFGEIFTVYDRSGGWAWGQSQTDGYVGYVRAEGLSDPAGVPNHEVLAPRSLVFAEPDLKSPLVTMLHMTSRVVVSEEQAGFCLTNAGGWVPRQHLAAIGETATNLVEAARCFLGAPYLWGGRSSLGLDCSGLVQLALARAGRSAPRDTDQQERSVGRVIEDGVAGAEPGDLLYMKGHVVILSKPGWVLHANAHHMAVAEEPLDGFLRRIEAMGLGITSVRRP